MVKNNPEAHFQLFEHEYVLNGYYHLVQKRLHGLNTKRPYVGLKDWHIQEAEKLGLPIMVHLCPNVNLSGTSDEKTRNLKNCTYKDQTQVMILKQEDLYKFKTRGMQESKSRNSKGELRIFTRNKYQVWHYQWLPDYIEGKGIINKGPTTKELGLI